MVVFDGVGTPSQAASKKVLPAHGEALALAVAMTNSVGVQYGQLSALEQSEPKIYVFGEESYVPSAIRNYLVGKPNNFYQTYAWARLLSYAIAERSTASANNKFNLVERLAEIGEVTLSDLVKSLFGNEFARITVDGAPPQPSAIKNYQSFQVKLDDFDLGTAPSPDWLDGLRKDLNEKNIFN